MSMPDLQYPATTASRAGQTWQQILKRVMLFSGAKDMNCIHVTVELFKTKDDSWKNIVLLYMMLVVCLIWSDFLFFVFACRALNWIESGLLVFL